MKKFINKIYLKYNSSLLKFFCFIYRKNKVKNNFFVFQSEGDYTDNARALSDYILNNMTKNNIKLIWIVKNKKEFRNNEYEKFFQYYTWNPLEIKRKSNILCTAKYFFFTHPWWFKKIHKEQVVVNLWHGTTFKNPTTSIGNTYDYMICPSFNVMPWLSKFTGTPRNKMIYCGYPRNDYLMIDNHKKINKILKINNQKVIICMPTYHQTNERKDSSVVNKYIIPFVENELDLIQLNNKLDKENVILIIKPHHCQIFNYDNNINLKNIIFINDDDLIKYNIQLYELLSCTDALLTDLSSVYFDYLLLDKPIGFYLKDVEDYELKRGYMISNYKEYMPGDFIIDINSFYLFIENISKNFDKFKQDRAKINNFVNKYKVNNCERLLNFLKIKI